MLINKMKKPLRIMYFEFLKHVLPVGINRMNTQVQRIRNFTAGITFIQQI